MKKKIVHSPLQTCNEVCWHSDRIKIQRNFDFINIILTEYATACETIKYLTVIMLIDKTQNIIHMVAF